jgi:CheY-like chemotaxis protein
VVLCDIGLPGKLSGYDVGRALRDEPALASLRRIALTGYGQSEDLRRALEAGFEHHVLKPVDPDTIEWLLARLAREGTRPV